MAMVVSQIQHSAWNFSLLCIWASAVMVFADERSSSLTQNATRQLSCGLLVENSPGSKPGATMVVKRVYLQGLSRLKNLGKYSNTIKVKVLPLPSYSNIRLPNIEVCFHRIFCISCIIIHGVTTPSSFGTYIMLCLTIVVATIFVHYRPLFKSAKKSRRRSQDRDPSPFGDSHDEHMYNKMQNKEH